MRPLPPHWPKFIAGLPLLFVFVGASDCFEHANAEKKRGFFNHVPLADASDAQCYQWPTFDLQLIVILFARCTEAVEKALLAELMADEPKELSVRYWPDITTAQHLP